MKKRFIPSRAEREEKNREKTMRHKIKSNTQRSKMEDNSNRKIRFGALLSLTTPKEKDKTKSFMVYLDKPLPWSIIVTRVTKALEEFQ